MDNLGVAVNDTALANYALEKGIKKSTAQMSTQEKVGLAMELFMEKTAYAAGNYAKENDTLAGSLSTLKAAFKNFLSGADVTEAMDYTSGPNANSKFLQANTKETNAAAKALADSLVSTGNVITEKLQSLLPHLVSGINELMVSLTPELPGLLEALLPGVISGAVQLLGGLVNVLPSLANVAMLSIWPYLQDIFKVVFGVELPDWDVFKQEITNKWNNEVWPAIRDFFRIVLNIELPEDAGTLINNIWDYWTGTIWPGIKEAFSLTFKFLFGDWTEEDNQRAWAWWDGVLAELNKIIEWILSPSLRSADEVVEMIEEWWEGIRARLKLVLGITPEVESHIQQTQETAQTIGEGVAEKTGSSLLGDLAEQNAINFSKNSDSFIDWSSIWNALASHATGLDFVPYDNYLARLHYGETVLSRKDADAWRKGSTGNMAILAAKFDQMQDTLVQVLEGVRNTPIAVNIDSKTAAVLMAREMTKSIGNRNIQSLMGMGG